MKRALHCLILFLGGLSLVPVSAPACSACFGKSDGPLAAGMNWGIFSLLAVIVPVLGGFAAFFIYLARRAASTSVAAVASAIPETRQVVPEKELAEAHN